jgi:hypothetical protein
MLDSAVVWFGITIENALQERVKVKMGSEVHYNPKYSLARLLNAATKLPRPREVYSAEQGDANVWSPLLAWAGRGNSGVKRYKYVPPVKNDTEVNDG